MDIKPVNIKIRDLYDKFFEDEELGVTCYGDRLNVRPPYQRNFVYDTPEEQRVIESILKDRPLNSIYFCKCKEDSLFEYEVLDGQQRILSICHYIRGDFFVHYSANNSFDYFHGLDPSVQEKIYNYELNIYICDGDDEEKLDWFETINIATKELTKQELKNAIYNGPWVTEVKKYFSKKGSPCGRKYGNYLSGHENRQEYLETALKWITKAEDRNKDEKIKVYMSDKRNKPEEAPDLWNYIEKIFNWVNKVFPLDPKKYTVMKGIEWGTLYEKYSALRQTDMTEEVLKLLKDKEVQNKKGIFEYLLDTENGNREKYLNLRAFDDDEKQMKYEEQNHICPICKKEFLFNEMAGDHIVPWSKGGKTEYDNLQMLCRKCNSEKSNH